jgi:hypothetical protein
VRFTVELKWPWNDTDFWPSSVGMIVRYQKSCELITVKLCLIVPKKKVHGFRPEVFVFPLLSQQFIVRTEFLGDLEMPNICQFKADSL